MLYELRFSQIDFKVEHTIFFIGKLIYFHFLQQLFAKANLYFQNKVKNFKDYPQNIYTTHAFYRVYIRMCLQWKWVGKQGQGGKE